MGIVRFALRWPYTYYVSALLILFLGVTAFRSMPADIFPEIDIPVVTVIWQYTGLSTPEMEQRVTSYSEYAMSTNAQTLNGISVQKVYFQSDVNFDLAIAQIISATNYIRVLMPAGIQAPLVVQYNASGFPVLQISLSSDTVSGQQLYDYGLYNLRQRLAPIHGVTFPTPAGGKYRQIMVDLDPAKLLAKGLTPLDVVNAVNAQSPAAIAPSRNTESTEALTNTDWSNSSLISMPGGAEARATLSACLTCLTTSTVEALPFLMTLSRTERRPSARTTFCCTSEPSRTWPTSLANLTGMLFRSSIVAGIALVRTVYCVSPIFAVGGQSQVLG